MMRIKKMMLSVALVMLVFTGMKGQSIDEAKMNRDLEVAKNVLQTLIQENQTDGFMVMGRNNIDVSYMDDFGVVFTLPDDNMFFIQNKRNRAVISQRGRGNRSRVIQYDVYGEVDEDSEAPEDDEDTLEETIIYDGAAAIEEGVYTFFADYAILIGQLKDTDKILVSKTTSGESYIWSSGTEIEAPQGLSMEVKVSDIKDYKSGKISLEKFKERVKVNRESSLEGHSDFRMFSSILKQYYSSDITQTYFISREPTFEYLDGLGVIYNVKTFSSYQDGDTYRIPGTDKSNYTQSERNEAVKEMYPSFEEDIKNFILDYGRTVRSLEDDEMLMLKIKMTRCEGCGIPKTLELNVKSSVLKQYDQQKLTKDKALSSIEVKKIMD